jgi:hypothetical protein
MHNILFSHSKHSTIVHLFVCFQPHSLCRLTVPTYTIDLEVPRSSIRKSVQVAEFPSFWVVIIFRILTKTRLFIVSRTMP